MCVCAVRPLVMDVIDLLYMGERLHFLSSCLSFLLHVRALYPQAVYVQCTCDM